MGRRAKPDWQRIRADYETGAYTLQALCDLHGIKHRSTIQNRITREGWVKDPTDRVKRIRAAKLAELDASEHGGSCEQDVNKVHDKPAVVEKAAQRQVDIIASHRNLTARLRLNVNRVLELVEQYLSGNQEERIEAMAVLKLGSGDSLTGHLSTLAGTIERVVRMERDSYGLSNAEAGMTMDRAEALRSEIRQRMVRLAEGS